MTKKHFEALAGEMYANKPFSTGERLEQWTFDCLGAANMCELFSPRFDRARFLKACGVEN